MVDIVQNSKVDYAGVGIMLLRFTFAGVSKFSFSSGMGLGFVTLAIFVLGTGVSDAEDVRRRGAAAAGLADEDLDNGGALVAGVGVAIDGRGFIGGGPIEPSSLGFVTPSALTRVLLARAAGALILPGALSSLPESDMTEGGREFIGVEKTLDSR